VALLLLQEFMWFTVCVTETRNGIVIATQRKDLQIKVGDCSIAKAVLKPQYITCDGFTMSFSKSQQQPVDQFIFLDFGVTNRNDRYIQSCYTNLYLS